VAPCLIPGSNFPTWIELWIQLWIDLRVPMLVRTAFPVSGAGRVANVGRAVADRAAFEARFAKRCLARGRGDW